MPSIVKAGTRGVDFSFAKPPAQRLVELGYEYVVGYISVPPASPAKNLTKTQCEDYIAAGLKVLLVWEMDAARPNKGATYGAIDGKSAAQRAAALGYPTDVPILSAADLNSFSGNIDQHEAYMRAFEANCGPWPMGIYGDTDILARTAGLWRIGWVPLGAWAWSGTSYKDALAKSKAVGAHVLQSKGFYIDNLWAVDPNDTIIDFPAWGTATITELPDVTDPVIVTPPPPSDEEEDSMRIKTPGQWFEKVGLDVRTIGNGKEFAGLPGNEVELSIVEMGETVAACRYTYGPVKAEMGTAFVVLWNSKREPALSSGGGGGLLPTQKITMSGTVGPA